MHKSDIVVLLHNIRSLHNVGSIFRTADAAGISKIYLCGITPTPLDRFGRPVLQLTKVALGAEKSVPWEAVRISAETKLMDKLKKDGYKILAIEQSKKSVTYNKFKLSGKIAVIMGNEVRGLPAGILKKSDKILEIPMRGKKESLNVSVAFGVAVFGLLYR